MHFRSFGAGPRQILAVHCTLSHGGAWQRMTRVCADRWTVTACDLPGHGKSDAWDGSSDLLETTVSALTENLGTRTDVIGHSFGAVVALRLAQRFPDRIRRLCLFEPVLFAASALDDPAVLTRYRQDAEPIMAALSRGDLASAARLFNRTWGDGRHWDDISFRTRKYMTERMPYISAQDDILVDDVAGMLKPEALSRAAMPVLLMTGTESPEIVGSISRALVSHLPLAWQVNIPRASHMGPVTHPEDVAGAIDHFLEMAEEEIDVFFRDRPVTDQPR